MLSRVGRLEYVVEVAKDWTLARFAAAQRDFALPPHRFELCDATVRRHAISPTSPEARSPSDAVSRAQQQTAWSHAAVQTILVDSETGTVEYEQEVAEILMMDDEVLAEFAFVIRTGGLPPCLGHSGPHYERRRLMHRVRTVLSEELSRLIYELLDAH